MRVAVCSSKSYDKTFFEAVNAGKHQFVYLESRLDSSTALCGRLTTVVVCL